MTRMTCAELTASTIAAVLGPHPARITTMSRCPVSDDDVPELIPAELLKEVPDDDERDIRALGFGELTKAERQEMALRSAHVRRAKARARKLAELEVYTEAHRELASQILGTKMSVLDGLIDEMKDPVSGKLETSRLDEKRLKLLLSLVEKIEMRGFGGIVAKTESHSTVDIRAAVVDLTKRLAKPDTV